MRFTAARRLAAVSPLLLALAACEGADGRHLVPTEPGFARNPRPANGTGAAQMTITPTSSTVAVGTTTTISVTYVDARGAVVPDTDFRWTYYGCVPVQPAASTCNGLLSLLPLSPSLRQAEVRALAPGSARIYASDGLGTYVWADVTIR